MNRQDHMLSLAHTLGKAALWMPKRRKKNGGFTLIDYDRSAECADDKTHELVHDAEARQASNATDA